MPPPGTSPSVIANVLKQFLRTLPEPLLTYKWESLFACLTENALFVSHPIYAIAIKPVTSLTAMLDAKDGIPCTGTCRALPAVIAAGQEAVPVHAPEALAELPAASLNSLSVLLEVWHRGGREQRHQRHGRSRAGSRARAPASPGTRPLGTLLARWVDVMMQTASCCPLPDAGTIKCRSKCWKPSSCEVYVNTSQPVLAAWRLDG